MASDEDIKRLAALFDGSDVGFGTHGEPRRRPDELKWEIKSTARTLKGKVTHAMWCAHIAGKVPLGCIPIRSDGMVLWGSIDYDIYNANPFEIIERINKAKLPLVACRSKSGGLHLWIFLKRWMPAADLMACLRDMAAQIGIAGSEIFPKQQAIDAARGDLGNWMVMPYFGSTYDGKIQLQVGLKKTGAEMGLSEFLTMAEEARVDPDDLTKLTRKRVSSGRGPNVNLGKPEEIDITNLPDPDEPFGDGPPCLQTMAGNGVERGTQNDTLMMMGVYYKRRYPDDWKNKLHLAAQEFLQPVGDPAKTAQTIKSLERKEYFYSCSREPFKGHCNSAICRTRAFGVGALGDYPVILEMKMLPSDPPVFFVQLLEHRLELTTEQLMEYKLFCRVAAKHKLFFSSMAQKDWNAVVKVAGERSDVIEMPFDVGEHGIFMELLEDFCSGGMQGDKLADLFSGKPYLGEDSYHHFRLRDFDAYVVSKGMKQWGRGKLATLLRNIDSEPYVTTCEKRTLRAWKVSKARIEEPPKIPPPKREEPGI